MRGRNLFGAGLLAILAALSVTACHHRSPADRIGWMIEEIDDRLSLNDFQKERLEAIAQEFMARKKRIHEDRETVRETVVAELKKEHMDRAVIHRVFEPFFREDDSRSRSTGGFGLGLSLCKAIVTAHGGTIEIASIPDEGSTVAVHIPIAHP